MAINNQIVSEEKILDGAGQNVTGEAFFLPHYARENILVQVDLTGSNAAVTIQGRILGGEWVDYIPDGAMSAAMGDDSIIYLFTRLPSEIRAVSANQANTAHDCWISCAGRK